MLPGTCTHLTYEDTRKNYKELNEKANEIIHKAIEVIVKNLITHDTNVVRIERLRPGLDTLKFDNDQQEAFLINTLSFDRFEHLHCKFGDKPVIEGSCLIQNLGFSLLNKKIIEDSMTVTELHMEENEHGFRIENRYYKIQLGKDGHIHSWRDRRTKHFEREICRHGDTINKVSMH